MRQSLQASGCWYGRSSKPSIFHVGNAVFSLTVFYRGVMPQPQILNYLWSSLLIEPGGTRSMSATLLLLIAIGMLAVASSSCLVERADLEGGYLDGLTAS